MGPANPEQEHMFTTRSREDKPPPMAYALIAQSAESGVAAQVPGEEAMTLDPVLLNPLIALIAGILILLMPRLLNFVVAIYLIVIGILGLAHHFQ
jgi:hypothetical protein